MNDKMNDKMNEITDNNAIKLGPRLHTIASFVPTGANLGDIGTDHAYLPVYLLQTGKISKAIGIDIHKGPYESAQQTVNTYGLTDKIAVRLGNGLAPLTESEVDTLTIAGMGGTTILEILNSNPKVIGGVAALVLQPQGAEARVRTELLALGWLLKEECLVEEDDRVYTIIHFSRREGLDRKKIEGMVDELVRKISTEAGYGKINADQELISWDKYLPKIIWQLGPLILHQREKLLAKILGDSIANQGKVILEMSRAERDDVKIQAEDLKQEMKVMEGIKTWLYL